MSLRATVARRYCAIHERPRGRQHTCEMGERAAEAAAAACVEWLESKGVTLMVDEGDERMLARLIEAIQEEDA